MAHLPAHDSLCVVKQEALGRGSVQYLSAGSGIVHSEMPEQHDGLMHGFQLWVNLPARDKMTAPRYQDIAPERIPEVAVNPHADRRDDSRVRVIAGQFGDVDGPVQAVATDPLYLDVQLGAGGRFEVTVPVAHTAFVYAYHGLARVGPDAHEIVRGDLAVLGDGPSIVVTAAPDPRP